MHPVEIRKRVELLRRAGKTYGEIQNILGIPISKSTLSDWCNSIELSGLEKTRLEAMQVKNSERGLFFARAVTRRRRQEYLTSVDRRTAHLPELLNDRNVAKIALGMLYLGEGSKSAKHAALTFGNSDPGVISLFLYLLRFCYSLDERKFRCTVQCRADQDIKALENFWLGITKIPRHQFYKAKIDSRTVGQTTRKPGYKGVCRINYFSADLYYELISIGKAATMGLW